MKKVLLLGIMIAGVLFSHLQAFSQDEATKPSYRRGDTWLVTAKSGNTMGSDPSRMLNGTYELTIVDGKVKIATVNGSEKAELEPRPSTLICLLAYCPNLDFPLTVGKQWKRDYKTTYIGSNKEIRRTAAYEVKGIEQVTTPAGTFRAFKIEIDDRSGPRDFWVTNYWYSPETKSIVKHQFDASSGGQVMGLKTDIELIKFTPAN
jgi:hypothetical protein